MRYLRTNTAVRVTVGPFIGTDGLTPKTSLTVTNDHLTFMVDSANVPTLVLDTSPTASGGSNDMVHVTGDDAGFYDLELAAADTNYLGRAMLALTDATNHCPVFHEFMILPAMIYDSLVLGTDDLDTNSKKINDVATSSVTTVNANVGTTQPTNFTGTGGSATVNSTVPDTQKVDVNTIKTNPVVNGGTVTFPTTATLASTTNITAATGIDATKWAGGTIVSPNITGLPLVDVKGFIGTTLTETSTGYISAAFKHMFDVVSAAFTASSVNQTGDNYARIGAAGAGLTALGDTRIANLDATISSRTKPADTQARVTLVDTLTTYTGNTPQTADNAAAGTRTLLALPAFAPDALGGLGTTRSGNKVWFYDAVNGSDANSGLSDNAALQTISAVCSVAKAGHAVIVLSASSTVTGNQTISTSGVRWYFQSSAIFTATSGTTIAITGHDNEFHNPTWRTTDATNGWPFSLAANTRNNKMFGGNIGSNNIGLDACSIAGAINFYAEGTTFTNPYDTIYGVSASARFVGCKFVMSASYSSGSPPDYSTIICDGSTVTFENCRTVIIKAAGNVTTGDVSVFRINAGDPLQGSLRVINHTAQVEIDEATQVCNVHLLKIMGSYPGQAHIEGGNFISYNLGAASITTLTIKADSDDYVEVKGLAAPRSWTGNVLWPTDDASTAATVLSDARPEPAQGTPAVDATFAEKVDYLYKAWRNKSVQTASEYRLYDDAGSTVDHKGSFSDSGTAATRGELATGP